MEKILMPIFEHDIAPRFDLATEVIIVELDEHKKIRNQKTIVMPHASAEELCALILKEDINVVLCNGIEDEYYQYLRWKKIKVYDSIMDSYNNALNAYILGEKLGG